MPHRVLESQTKLDVGNKKQITQDGACYLAIRRRLKKVSMYVFAQLHPPTYNGRAVGRILQFCCIPPPPALMEGDPWPVRTAREISWFLSPKRVIIVFHPAVNQNPSLWQKSIIVG